MLNVNINCWIVTKVKPCLGKYGVSAIVPLPFVPRVQCDYIQGAERMLRSRKISSKFMVKK